MSAIIGGVRKSFPVTGSHNSESLPTRGSISSSSSTSSVNYSHSFNSSESYSPKRPRTYSSASSNSLSRTPSYSSITNYCTHPRRMTNTVRASNRAAILAVGEELRVLLHAEDPPILKDRRYHLKVYPTCFVGHEMVDWLLKKGEVESRAEAVAMMQKLLENSVIHHVCDDHDFKDEKLFFRFRRDDNTYEEPPDALIVAKGQRIYSRLRTDGSNLIQDRKYHLQTFKQSFIGREFVDWLITRGEANTRDEAVKLGRSLLEAGVFRHVCNDHHFKDEYLFFRFKNDEPRQKSFGKRVGVSKGRRRRDGSVMSTEENYENHQSSGIYSEYSNSGDHLASGGDTPPEHEDEYIQMQSATEEPGYIKMEPSPEPSTLPPPTVEAPRVLKHLNSRSDIDLDEIADPNGRYIKRSINVVSDPVGYGFVIRGSRPVYVHTIDPSGPAATAGLQVGEYLHSVNGQYVLDKSHTDVARIILMGTSTAYLVTYIEKEKLQSPN